MPSSTDLDCVPNARDELEDAVRVQAEDEGIRLADGVARMLVEAARGVRWEALRLLDRALDQVAIRRGGDRLLLDDVREALRVEGFDDRGLTRDEQRVLRVIEEHGPLSPSHIAGLVGKERATVEEQLEPMLLRLGLISITDHGRVPRGWEAPVESTKRPVEDEPDDGPVLDKAPDRVRDMECHGGYPPRPKSRDSARYFARIRRFLIP